MKSGILRLLPDGLLDPGCSMHCAATLQGSDACQVQGIRVPGLYCKCLFVKGLCLSYPPCLMLLQAFFEQFLNRGSPPAAG
jgi:hypothetical protein